MTGKLTQKNNEYKELGDFLRAVRERRQPQGFDFPSGPRRRTQGLRREEVAALCGISPTWYTWIEQGRTAAVSVATLSSLARGLRLSLAERAYLFQLAGRADPMAPGTRDADAVPYDVLVSAINSPAYVLDRHWDVRAWNAAAATLFYDWLGGYGQGEEQSDYNLLRYVFLDPKARVFIADWDERARRLVAEYRADSAAQRDDPVNRELVETLSRESVFFDDAWRSQAVLAREGGIRRFLHPKQGACAYRQFTLRLVPQSEIKLIVLHPVEEE